jgi:ribonucleotide reductase alpha subunit
MEVVKRDGRRENVQFDKITSRIKNLCKDDELKFVDPILVAQKTIQSIYNGITTEELDKISAQICHSLTFKHYIYSYIGARILISNIYKKTSSSFYETSVKLYEHKDADNNHCPIINKEYFDFISKHKEIIEKTINHDNDIKYNYFGFKTLERSYLLNFKYINTNEKETKMKIIERPQHMLMREACGIHYKKNDINNVIKTYNYLSYGYFTHATPTLFNAGTLREQLSSCFIENTEVMTMEGIKKIQEVNINDKIVTHTGKVKKILQVHKNLLNGRKIMNLEVYKTKSIKVTDNHKFWAISDDNKIPRWVPVSEMDTNYRIAIPSYKGEIKVQKIDIEQLIKDKLIDIKEYIIEDECIIPNTKHTSTHLNGGQHINMSFKGNKISKDIFIDEDLANIMGMFIGDGHIIMSKEKHIGIGFTINKDNLKEINFIKKTMVNVFNIPTVEHHIKTQNVIQLLYNSEILGKLFEYMFGKEFNEKQIWKNMIGWDINLVYNFLAGLITINGCISKEGNITVQMSNYNLMNELYHLFRLYGIDVSLNEVVNKSSKLATVISWMLSVPKIKYVLERTMKLYNDDRLANCIKKIDQHHINQSMATVIDDVKFLKIKNVSIDINNNPTYVYTLGVEDDHSYNVEGLICENCFLLGTHDSMTGIYKTIYDCAMISKYAGGIGVHISNIRAKGSIIKGTNGISQGIIPMLKVYNETARYVDQGGGKRNGSIVCYLEPHHADIMDFLDLKKNTGAETERARDLFLALWISDLFMKVLEKNIELNKYESENGKIKEEDYPDDVKWYLMCPNECPGLTDVYGEKYEELYYKYVKENKYRRWIRPIEIFDKIYDSWIETGVPYIGFKDHVNRKNNQKNSGTIKSSNLCVSEDTLILTEKGYETIKDVCDQKVNIWNGDDFVETIIRKTGYNQKLMRITFSNGLHLDCTEYHIFLLKNSLSLDPKDAIRIEANKLKINDKIMNYLIPSRYEYPIKNIKDIPNKKIISVVYNITISKIEYLEGLHDTYCFYEEKKNAGIFNGILTGQCIEINEISSEEETACCLSSETDILTEKGYIKIKDYKDENILVPFTDDENFKLEYKYIKGKLKDNGIRKTYEIEMNGNRKIRATDDHRFVIITEDKYNNSKYKWKTVKELKVDDKMFKPKINEKNNDLNEMEEYIKIINIKEYGFEQVYDIVLPEGHNFISNGIVAHNCNLASIAVNKFIKTNELTNEKEYDFEKLKEIAYQVSFNLNRVIDINYYPTEEARKSNMKYRPIGLGIQGLADAYMLMRYPFESNEAMELNKKISECIYYGGLRASCDLAKEEGPYSEFKISPSAKGILQFDMWNIRPESGMCDWDQLKRDIIKYGIRNSLITAMMPTASTSQILDNNECFEPITANIYYRSTLAGMFNIVNKYLIDDLVKLNLWNDKMKDMILYYNGSIQNIANIPKELKELYKTVWEIKQKTIIDQARDRGAYVDQSQSMNLFFAEPSKTKLLSAMIYGWKQGLKTGVYYVRTKPATNAIKFTIDSNIKNNIENMLKEENKEDVKYCKIKRKGMTAQELAECESCSG